MELAEQQKAKVCACDKRIYFAALSSKEKRKRENDTKEKKIESFRKTLWLAAIRD